MHRTTALALAALALLSGCKRVPSFLQTIPPDADLGRLMPELPDGALGSLAALLDATATDTGSPRADTTPAADTSPAPDTGSPPDTGPPPRPPMPTPVVNPEPTAPVVGDLADLPSRPISCGRDRVIFLDRVSIDHPSGVAVRATGNCAVRISNCSLRGNIGVQVSGRATVHLTRCRVTGATFAIDASGTSAVRLSGCSVAGATRQTERALIEGS